MKSVVPFLLLWIVTIFCAILSGCSSINHLLYSLFNKASENQFDGFSRKYLLHQSLIQNKVGFIMVACVLMLILIIVSFNDNVILKISFIYMIIQIWSIVHSIASYIPESSSPTSSSPWPSPSLSSL